MKKLMITAISLISVLVVGLTVFAACGKKHNFSKSYSYDDSYHWHACTDKKCKEVKDKAKHTFGNWTVTKQPTATEKGSKSHSCTVCKKKVTEEIPATGKSDNAVTLKEGVMLDKMYDGTAVMFKAEQFSFMGTGAVTFKFQVKGSAEWVDKAPMEVGMYQVKVMVAESASYKACEGMFPFEIKKGDNAVTLKEGVVLDKTYDGTAVMFKAEQFSFMGDGAVTFKFQVKGSEEWVDEAPMEVGMYRVKVMVAESASYKACEGMFDFEITSASTM